MTLMDYPSLRLQALSLIRPEPEQIVVQIFGRNPPRSPTTTR